MSLLTTYLVTPRHLLQNARESKSGKVQFQPGHTGAGSVAPPGVKMSL